MVRRPGKAVREELKMSEDCLGCLRLEIKNLRAKETEVKELLRKILCLAPGSGYDHSFIPRKACLDKIHELALEARDIIGRN